MSGFPQPGSKTSNNNTGSLSSDYNIPSTGTNTIVSTSTMTPGQYLVIATLAISGATTAGIFDIQLVIPGVGILGADTLSVAVSTDYVISIYAAPTLTVSNVFELQTNSGASGGPVGAIAKHVGLVGGNGPATMITAIQIA
jgi:hypothetical protein